MTSCKFLTVILMMVLLLHSPKHVEVDLVRFHLSSYRWQVRPTRNLDPEDGKFEALRSVKDLVGSEFVELTSDEDVRAPDPLASPFTILYGGPQGISK